MKRSIKEKLIDYIESFVVFDNDKKLSKIIAKNHQYLGVNNLMKSIKNRKELKEKLGVFWHTQGSGKSYSMIFFTRKVNRKMNGNFSFLIITDRDDLDTQIKKTLIRCEVVGSKDEVSPVNSSKLREYLTSNKPFVFTLVQKFRLDKKKDEKRYPLLPDRDDIIVLVDEAHRTEYANLAENMREGLPNASFIAFTGTPLLGSKRLTNQWFGDYVSIYDFKRSVDYGSTVPLYYSRRVPEVGIMNDFLDDDKFAAYGLDIKKHREEMDRIDKNGCDIEDRFKNPENPFSLVFVCAMWLTGFDVANLSTLYLDKPMKSHTLMQAIARANRVYEGKECGLIIDYLNIFAYMRKALSDYAIGDDTTEMPVKNIDKLIGLLDVTIE